jgi:hypothetical protein
MWRRAPLIMATLLLSAHGIAQEENISVDSSVTPEQIKEWLQSNDSRLVAWGAYFSSKSDDPINADVYTTIMARRLAQWIPPANHRDITVPDDQPFRISEAAIEAILDALIVKKQTVPSISIAPIVLRFPTEALILASRLPGEDRPLFLEQWWQQRASAPDQQYLQNKIANTNREILAAMLLAKDPPPGFAASVIAEYVDQQSFWVLDNELEKQKLEGGRLLPCQEAARTPLPPISPMAERMLREWPPQIRYILSDPSSPAAGELLVDAGGQQIIYSRISGLTVPPECSRLKLSMETLYAILAEMTGLDDKARPWQTHEDVIHIWKSDEGFLSALKLRIQSEESKLKMIVNALEMRGYLTPDEAHTARPRLRVLVNDARASVGSGQHLSLPPPLPNFVSSDPTVSVVFDRR